jgi:hypothetical protein
MDFVKGQAVTVSQPGRPPFRGVVEHIHTAPGYVAVRDDRRRGVQTWPARFVALALEEGTDTMKVYKRTENGVTTFVSLKDGAAEADRAQMGPRRDIREMSSSRGRHSIVYRDGRKVTLVMVDRQEDATPRTIETGHTAPRFHIVTVKGKRYAVSEIIPARPWTPGAKTWIPYASVSYWSERNGERFGATRTASEVSKPSTVGRAIWDAVNR